MDWSNERYVRLYTRDTDTWISLSWQARALLALMLRKVDRAGVLETVRGARGVAGLTTLPLEVVEVGLADLLEAGTVREIGVGYFMPKFLEAQEAPMSDAQRARDSRERRRDKATAAQITRDVESQNGASASHSVTETSQAVTPRHTASLQPTQTNLPTPSKSESVQPVNGTAALVQDVREIGDLQPKLFEHPNVQVLRQKVDRQAARDERLRASVALVFGYWQVTMHHEDAILNQQRGTRIAARLRENAMNASELLYTLDGALRDDWLMGRHAKSERRYDDIKHIFRDREQVERLCKLGGYRAGLIHPFLTPPKDGGT